MCARVLFELGDAECCQLSLSWMLDVFIALNRWCLTGRDCLSAPRREVQVEEGHSTEITFKDKIPPITLQCGNCSATQ